MISIIKDSILTSDYYDALDLIVDGYQITLYEKMFQLDDIISDFISVGNLNFSQFKKLSNFNQIIKLIPEENLIHFHSVLFFFQNKIKNLNILKFE